MNYKEQKLKEFKNFASGTEIEYDYPLDQHIIYDDIELFISNVIDEQEKIHKISNECMKVCYEESEKRLILSKDKIQEATIDLVDKHFPKGECKERGSAIVLYAEIIINILALQSKE